MKYVYALIMIILFSSCNEKSSQSHELIVYDEIMPLILDTLHLDLYEEYDNPELNIRLRDSVLNLTKSTLLRDELIAVDAKLFNEIVKKNNYKTIWNKEDYLSFSFSKEFEKEYLHHKVYLSSNHPLKKKELFTYNAEKEFLPKEIYFEVSMSRIVFNEKFDEGFLQVGSVCGELCGQGYDIWIKKINNKWEIINVKRTWIA